MKGRNGILSNQTDEEIAESVQTGKKQNFCALIARYEDKMRRYGRKFLSDQEDINDVLQEVFIKAYENIQSFDSKRRFSPWIYRIAHNEMVNALKKKSKNPLPLFDLDVFFPHSLRKKNDINEEIERKEISAQLDMCLQKLEAKYREPLILYYYEDLSYKEIADIMAVPVSTVGIRIKRGKDMLKSVYEIFEKDKSTSRAI